MNIATVGKSLPSETDGCMSRQGVLIARHLLCAEIHLKELMVLGMTPKIAWRLSLAMKAMSKLKAEYLALNSDGTETSTTPICEQTDTSGRNEAIQRPDMVPEPVRAGPVKAVITGTGDGAAEVSDVPQGGDSGADKTPNRRTREAYNAYMRGYMKKRRAK